MADSIFDARAVSRRRFLAMGGTVAAAGTLGPWLDPLPAFGASKWPKGRLGARDAIRVKESDFMPVGQFRRWNDALDRIGPANQKGLRATGSKAHEGYVDDLRDDLERAGVEQLHFESVPMERWTTTKWSLDLLDGAAAGPVKTASYVPYSGQTPAAGITGQLVHVEPGATPAPGSLAGKIALFDVPLSAIPLSFFTALAYGNRLIDPDGDFNGSYKRPYLSGFAAARDRIAPAGPAGMVAVLDYPFDGAAGSYFPYEGIIHDIPGLFVDRTVGAALAEQARDGTNARLTLPATVKRVKSRNLIGVIPGESKELVTLHCHTDGSNAIEDNGPAAIVAISQYLARLPRRALPRTIMILLTTGHFAGGNGARAFRARHENDLVKRTNAALTIEHLGLREWDELPTGTMGPTGRWEPGAIFAPGSEALVDASFTALKRGKASPAAVLAPLDPNGNGTTEPTWPGEGQYLFAQGGMPTANYITGPTYLLNWGITTTDKVDFGRVRREAIAFTEMILRLGRTPGKQLRTYTL